MALKITFLGTSSMVPTKERNVQSIHLDFNGEGILVDCGEGSQRQMNIAGINRLKIRKILISHWHGDHVSGLIGLIQTMGSIFDPDTIIDIYGPIGTKIKMHHLLQTCYFDLRIKLKIHELSPKKVERFYENEIYAFECTKLEHGIPCIGYSFIIKEKIKINMDKVDSLGLKQGKWLQKIQKGKPAKVNGKIILPEQISSIESGTKVSFVLDTKYCENAVSLSEKADLLISEAVYADDLEEKAEEYNHMTAKDAATIAKTAKVERLILTHISQRYKSPKKLLTDAKKVFLNTEVAKDFLEINL